MNDDEKHGHIVIAFEAYKKLEDSLTRILQWARDNSSDTTCQAGEVTTTVHGEGDELFGALADAGFELDHDLSLIIGGCRQTKIYAFKTGQAGRNMLIGGAFVEKDGELHQVGGHCSSNLGFLKGDLGFVESPMGIEKRKKYAELFPEGFEVIWVDDPRNHDVIRKYCDREASDV